MEVHKEDEKHLIDEEKDYFKTHEVVTGKVGPQDPLHDIDTKKTVTLLLVWTAALFVGIWVMAQLFHFMVRGERDRKVASPQEEAGPLAREMKDLRAQEDKEIAGEDDNKSLEVAMKEYLEKNQGK